MACPRRCALAERRRPAARACFACASTTRLWCRPCARAPRCSDAPRTRAARSSPRCAPRSSAPTGRGRARHHAAHPRPRVPKGPDAGGCPVRTGLWHARGARDGRTARGGADRAAGGARRSAGRAAPRHARLREWQQRPADRGAARRVVARCARKGTHNPRAARPEESVHAHRGIIDPEAEAQGGGTRADNKLPFEPRTESSLESR